MSEPTIKTTRHPTAPRPVSEQERPGPIEPEAARPEGQNAPDGAKAQFSSAERPRVPAAPAEPKHAPSLWSHGVGRPETSKKDRLTEETDVLGDLARYHRAFEAGTLNAEGMGLAKGLIESAIGRELAPWEWPETSSKEAHDGIAKLFDSAELNLKKGIREKIARLVPPGDLMVESAGGAIRERVVKAGDREIHYGREVRGLKSSMPTAEFLKGVKQLAEDARAVSLAAGIERALSAVDTYAEAAKKFQGNASDRLSAATSISDRGLDQASLERLRNPARESYDADAVRNDIHRTRKGLLDARAHLAAGDAKKAAEIFTGREVAGTLSTMPQRAEMFEAVAKIEQIKGSVAAVVISGALAEIAAVAATPALVTAFGASGLGRTGVAIGRAATQAATFTTGNRAIGATLGSGELYDENLGAVENLGEYGKEILFTAGMFKVIGAATRVAGEAFARGIYSAAAKKLVAKGSIEAAQIGTETSKKLIVEEASRMYAARGLAKTGAFTFEAATFQGWEYVKAQVERHVFDKNIDPETAFAPQSFVEGGKFLALLKVGGFLARPITLPASEAVKRGITAKYGDRLGTLQKEINGTLSRLKELVEGGRADPAEMDALFQRIDGQLTQRAQLEGELSRVGALDPSEEALTRAVRKRYAEARREMPGAEEKTPSAFGAGTSPSNIGGAMTQGARARRAPGAPRAAARGERSARQRTRPALRGDPVSPNSQRGRARNPIAASSISRGRILPAADDPVRIVRGEAGEGKAPSAEMKTPLGTAVTTTHEGVGYKDLNEDGAALVRGPSGEIHLIDVDGMGGMSGGRAAANAVLETISTALSAGKTPVDAYREARREIREVVRPSSAKMKNANAVAVSATIVPPSRPGEPARARFNWVGDARGVLLRRLPGGQLRMFYRTVDDNVAANKVRNEEKDPYRPGQQERIMRDPDANIVTQGMASKDMEIRSIGSGNGDIAPEYDISDFAEGIPLRDGDIVLLGSDGLWENFRSAGILADIISSCRTAGEIVDTLRRETLYRMEVLRWAGGQRPRPDGLIPFTYRGLDSVMLGEKLYLRSGDVFQETGPDFTPNENQTVEEFGGRRYLLVDHYKPDNLSITAYVHGEAAEPAESAAPLPPARQAVSPQPPPRVAPPPHPEPARPAATAAGIRLETSEGPIEVDPSAEAIYIGREPACQIKFSSDKVSRRHAMIAHMPDGSHKIINLSGTNPTLVMRAGDTEGRRLTLGSGGMTLHEGDAIFVGDQRFVWRGAAKESGRKPASRAEPAVPDAPQRTAHALPRMGIIFGGITNIGYECEIPHDGSVVKLNRNIEARFDAATNSYHVRENAGEWLALKPGQTVTLGDYSYSVGEFGGADSITSGKGLMEQVRIQLATEGKKQRLTELASRGVRVTDVDGKNIDVFGDESFDRAAIAYDSGHLDRTAGGLLGGTSTVYAFVDPATGGIHGFCTDAPEVKDSRSKPRLNVTKAADGRYIWTERNGLAPPKYVDMSAAPPGSVIVPFTFERMTGRIFVDRDLQKLPISREAVQHLARLEGLTVRMGGAAMAAWLRYLDKTKIPPEDDK